MQVHGEDRTACVGRGGGTYQERTGQCGENLGLVRKVGWPVFKTVKQKERSFVA